MNDREKRIEKVIKFYQSLPDSLKQVIFDNVQFANRKNKREFSKIKSINEKIKRAVSSSSMRENFSNAAYIAVKHHINLTLDSALYEDIISHISKETEIYYVIFFFRWCYETNQDDICNYDKYFDQFVDSDLFNRILNGELVNINNTSNNIQDTSDLKIEQVQVETRKKDNRMKLVGRIEKRNTYYNFFPQYKYLDGTYHKITEKELVSEFPQKGAINLAYTF